MEFRGNRKSCAEQILTGRFIRHLDNPTNLRRRDVPTDRSKGGRGAQTHFPGTQTDDRSHPSVAAKI